MSNPNGRPKGSKNKKLGKASLEALRPRFMEVINEALESSDPHFRFQVVDKFKDHVFSRMPSKVQLETMTVEDFIDNEKDEDLPLPALD